MLQYTQTQYSVSEIVQCGAIVVVILYALCTFTEWLTHKDTLLFILKRQGCWVRGLLHRIW